MSLPAQLHLTKAHTALAIVNFQSTYIQIHYHIAHKALEWPKGRWKLWLKRAQMKNTFAHSLTSNVQRRTLSHFVICAISTYPIGTHTYIHIFSHAILIATPVTYYRCEVSWTAGHIWLAFPFLGYFFDNRKGYGGGSHPHINIYKIQSSYFKIILFCPAVQLTSHSSCIWRIFLRLFYIKIL